MASRFEIFGRRLREICAINEVVVQRNTKKATNCGLSVSTGRRKIILMLNLQQNREMHLTKSPKCL